MKCVQKDNVVERVPDHEARTRVDQGWSYVPKRVWKARRATQEANMKR